MRKAFAIVVVLGLATASAACTTLLGDFGVSEGGPDPAGGGGGGAGGASCEVGWADCDDNPMDCEVDVTSPESCGACGAVCIGGSCQPDGDGYACSQVTELARGYPRAHSIVVYQGEVYWTSGTDAEGSVQKVPVRGGRPRSLATGQYAPYGVAVNAHGVFWASSYAKDIMRVDRDGAYEPELVYASQYTTLGVAADEREVFWAQRGGDIGDPGKGSRIGQVPMPNGPANPYYLDAEASSPHLLALDDMYVYWVDRRDKGRVLRTSRAADEAQRDATPVAQDQRFPYAIAVDLEHVYWTTESGVMQAPKDGSGRPAPLGGRPESESDQRHRSPNSIAVDDNDPYVYWTDQGAGRVRRTRKDGSGYQQDLYVGGTPRGIALDADFVYWVNENEAGSVLRTRRLP